MTFLWKYMAAAQLTLLSCIVSCNNNSNTTAGYCATAEIFKENDLTNAFFHRGVSNYWERPVKNAYKPIEVALDLGIRALIDVEERSEMIRMSAYIYQAWQDQIHVWNETEFRCITFIVLPHGKDTGIWLPDLAFMNAESKYALTRNQNELVRIRSDGYTTFSPGGIFDFHCSFDLSLFPFDTQKCGVEFESWRYSTFYQQFIDPTVELVNITEHEQWELMETDVWHNALHYSNGLSFDKVTFYITLRRKTAYYAATVVLPCLVVATVEIATFAIPHDKGIRIEVSFTCLLSFSVFMTSVVSEMPKSADHPPLLLQMICFIIVYIGIVILLQGLCLVLARKAERGDSPVPMLILKLTKVISRYVGIRIEIEEEIDEDIPHWEPETKKIANSTNDYSFDGINRTVEKQIKTKRRYDEEWNLIACTVDRIAFLLFVIFLATTTVALLGIMPRVKSNNV